MNRLEVYSLRTRQGNSRSRRRGEAGPLARRKGSVLIYIFVSGVGFLLRPGRDGDVAAGETEFAEFVLERLAVHPEDGGRARHVAAGVFQAARDVAALELLSVRAEVGRE